MEGDKPMTNLQTNKEITDRYRDWLNRPYEHNPYFKDETTWRTEINNLIDKLKSNSCLK